MKLFRSRTTLNVLATLRLTLRISCLSSIDSVGKLFPNLVFNSVRRVKCFEMSVANTVSMMSYLTSFYMSRVRFSIILQLGRWNIFSKAAAR